jgi:hypothetical protein
MCPFRPGTTTLSTGSAGEPDFSSLVLVFSSLVLVPGCLPRGGGEAGLTADGGQPGRSRHDGERRATLPLERFRMPR